MTISAPRRLHMSPTMMLLFISAVHINAHNAVKRSNLLCCYLNVIVNNDGIYQAWVKSYIHIPHTYINIHVNPAKDINMKEHIIALGV